MKLLITLLLLVAAGVQLNS